MESGLKTIENIVRWKRFLFFYDKMILSKKKKKQLFENFPWNENRRIHFINFLQRRNEIRMDPRHPSWNVILFNGNFAGGSGKENHFERRCLIAGTLNNNCSKPSAEFSKARVRTLLIRLRRRRFSRRRLIESVFAHKEAALLFEIRGVIILI